MIKLTFSCFVERESLHQRSLHKQRKMCCQIQRWRLLLQLVSSILQRKRLQNRYRNKKFTLFLSLSFLFVTIPFISISFVHSWTQFNPVLLPSNGLQRVPISEQADIDVGNSDKRPEKSLDSLVIAFIGLFPICLSRCCWFFFIKVPQYMHLVFQYFTLTKGHWMFTRRC